MLSVIRTSLISVAPAKVKEIRSIAERFRQVPEYRSRVESYPLWSLVTSLAPTQLNKANTGFMNLPWAPKRPLF